MLVRLKSGPDIRLAGYPAHSVSGPFLPPEMYPPRDLPPSACPPPVEWSPEEPQPEERAGPDINFRC